MYRANHFTQSYIGPTSYLIFVILNLKNTFVNQVQEDERHSLHTKQHFIYVHKGFMSVITIIGVQLDYARSTARAV